MDICYECGQAADTQDGHCAFCHHALCLSHTVRAVFFGDIVSWCEPCHARHEADQAEHRDVVGRRGDRWGV